jgi:hypothetical protein
MYLNDMSYIEENEETLVESELDESEEVIIPKPLSVKESFALFLADYKARMNQ